MIIPVNETLTAYRWQPFVNSIEVEGVDLGAASISLQLRLYPDALGDALLTLTRNDNPSAQGIAVRDSAIIAGLPTQTLQIRINETTLEQLMPFPNNGTEPGECVNLAYDLVIDLPGFAKARWMSGSFAIVPGANQL